MLQTFYDVLQRIEGKRNFECAGVTHYTHVDAFVSEMRDNGFTNIMERIETGDKGGWDTLDAQKEFLVWDFNTEEFLFLQSTDADKVDAFVDYILAP